MLQEGHAFTFLQAEHLILFPVTQLMYFGLPENRITAIGEAEKDLF